MLAVDIFINNSYAVAKDGEAGFVLEGVMSGVEQVNVVKKYGTTTVIPELNLSINEEPQVWLGDAELAFSP